MQILGPAGTAIFDLRQARTPETKKACRWRRQASRNSDGHAYRTTARSSDALSVTAVGQGGASGAIRCSGA